MRFYIFVAYLQTESKDESAKLENGIVFSPSREEAKKFIVGQFLKRWFDQGYSLELLSIDDKTEFIAHMLNKSFFSKN